MTYKFRILTLLFGFGLSGSVHALLIDSGALEFNTTGQSMWGSGQAVTLDKEVFLGTTWNTAPLNVGIGIGGSERSRVPGTGGTIPNPLYPAQYAAYLVCKANPFASSCSRPPTTVANPIPAQYIDTRAGYDATIATSGKAGFNLGVSLDSGSVGASVVYNAILDIPEPLDIHMGQAFNLNPNSVLASGNLSTDLANASAHVDAVLGVKGDLTGQVCTPVLGCSAPGATTVGFDPYTQSLAEFTGSEIKILGVADPAVFQFGDEINIPSTIPGGSFGGVTLYVPDIDTSGGIVGNHLSSSGMDDFMDMRVDLDGLIGAAVGLPGGGISVDAGIFSLSADLIDVDMGPTITLKQNFEFTPTLMVDLEFDRPVQVGGTNVTSLTSAWDSLPSLALLADETLVTPTFWLDGLFDNKTFLGIDGVFQVDVMKASLALEALGLSFDLGELGPLYQLLERGNLFDTPALFQDQFSLAGFNRIAGTSFLLQAGRSVPEPSTISLVLIGLLGMFATRRQNMKYRTQ